jgi:uncharacterized protein (TIGR02145 family)
MKKSAIFTIFLMSALLKTYSQDYLISFAGSGDTTVVSSVKVDNLTSGATVTLNGGDILHLFAPVGIDALNADNGHVQIYPNPMTEQAVLTFMAPESGNAAICIADLSGKTVHQISALLLPGRHSFHVSGIRRGLYFVKVTGKNYFYSGKLISQSALQSDVRIEDASSVMNIAENRLKSISSVIDMAYTGGDQLIYKGISGAYSNKVPDMPYGSKTITFNFASCTDADNNNYSTVQIGDQTWMGENLNAGVRLYNYEEQVNNGITEKYCNDDLATNCDIYGGLYQWSEMMTYTSTAGVQGICPTGWHLPTDEEWTTLTDNLGGESVAGGVMKSTGAIETGTGLWHSPNTGATNGSGFSALPGGLRDENFLFFDVNYNGFWWSSSESMAGYAFCRNMGYSRSNVDHYSNYEAWSFSVRCLRN